MRSSPYARATRNTMTTSTREIASYRYRAEELSVFGCNVLEHLNVPPEDAREVVTSLLEADLRGIGSHGLVRLPVYARRLRAGVVASRPEIKVERPAAAVALMDGGNGLGAVVGARAMATAIELAREVGIGLVGVRRSNHFGTAAHFVRKAVAADLIGTATTNAPPNMAPFGGRTRFLGTNPIAIGIPAGEEAPLIVDMSTSVVARGKIIVAAQQGMAIPEGWAIDADGRPTTDPERALRGAVLPFGGPKGSALSFVVDLLAGVWTGASFAVHLNTLEDLTRQQDVGHVVTAMRTDLFLSQETFRARMDEALRLLRDSPPAPGVERVLIPGELEATTEAYNRARGAPLPSTTVESLVTLGQQVEVAFPAALESTP